MLNIDWKEKHDSLAQSFNVVQEEYKELYGFVQDLAITVKQIESLRTRQQIIFRKLKYKYAKNNKDSV